MRVFLLSVMLLLSGCDYFSSAPKVGVVDMVRVVQESAPGRQALRQSAKAQEIIQGNLSAVEMTLSQYPNKGQAQQIMIGELNRLQKQLEDEQNVISKTLDDALARTIRHFQEVEKYDLILAKNTVLGYVEKVDVTAPVLAAFDRILVEFPVLPEVVNNPSLPAPMPVQTPVVQEPAPKPTLQTPPRR